MCYFNHLRGIVPLFKALIIQTVLVLISLIIIVTFPIVAMFFLIFFLFRETLKKYTQYFRPDLGNILTVRSTIQAVDALDIGNRTTVVLPLIFSGVIDISKFREDVYRKLIERDSDGKMKYSELQQSLFVYRGYAFWKWDKDFQIENHVVLGNQDDKIMNTNRLNLITAKLLREPFNKDRSPWDITLFPEYSKQGCTKPRSLVIVRFSHALVDARSVVQMLQSTNRNKLTLETLSQAKLGSFKRVRKVFRTATNLALLPYQLVFEAYASSDWNTFTYKESSDSDPLAVYFGEPVSVSLIKDIKNKLNSTFEGVLVSAYTAGLRKAMLANNVKIPSSVHGMLPQPMSGHKDKLRNLMKHGYLRMPVGIADPEERHKCIEDHLKTMKEGRFASQLYYVSLAVGVLPIYLVHLSMRLFGFKSFMMSNVSFPFKELKYSNHVLEEFKFAAGYRPGRTWFGITSLSYGDQLQIQVNFPKDTIFRENQDGFLHGIMEEFQILANTHLV